jgi:type IV secretory pathway VirB3-like protein
VDDLEGWHVPVYQSLTQPQLQCGVAQRLFIATLITSAIGVFWGLWWVLLVAAGVYGVARIGTRYDPYFFEIILAHVLQHDHYEG